MLGAIGQLAFTHLGNAFAGIGSVFDDQTPSVEMPKPDSMLFQRAICDAANGMTAHEIVEQADSVMSGMKEAYQRLYAKFQIKTLQNARRQHEVVAESLAHFRVVSARLLQERGFLGLEATIVLTVQNGTAHPIRRAMFHGRVVSPGRSVPWIEGDFNYSIPGGLEPGEKTTWRLTPSMFQGRWTSVRAPSDSRMEVRTVGLEGPDGEPLWGGVTFTTGDQKLLDSLMTRFGPVRRSDIATTNHRVSTPPRHEGATPDRGDEESRRLLGRTAFELPLLGSFAGAQRGTTLGVTRAAPRVAAEAPPPKPRALTV